MFLLVEDKAGSTKGAIINSIGCSPMIDNEDKSAPRVRNNL